MASAALGNSKCGARGTIITIGSLYSGVHNRLAARRAGGWVTTAASSSPRSTPNAKLADWPASSLTSRAG